MASGSPEPDDASNSEPPSRQDPAAGSPPPLPQPPPLPSFDDGAGVEPTTPIAPAQPTSPIPPPVAPPAYPAGPPWSGQAVPPTAPPGGYPGAGPQYPPAQNPNAQVPAAPYPPSGYGQQPAYAGGYPAAMPTTNGFAVAALVLGIVGVFTFWLYLIIPILAVVFGHIGYSKVGKSQGTQKGSGMALAGLILGYAMIAIGLFFLFIAIVAGT